MNKKTAAIVPFRPAVVLGGAHHGFDGQIPAYAAIERKSPKTLAEGIVIVDPLRAARGVGVAERAGLKSHGEATTIERYLERNRAAPRLLDLHVDEPAANREAIAMTMHEDTIVTGGIFVRFASGDLLALDWIYRPGETEGRRSLADFHDHLSYAKLPQGRVDVFGGGYAPSVMTEERMARAGWRERADKNVERMFAGLPQVGYPLEARWNGERMPATIVNSGHRFEEAQELLGRVAEGMRALARGSRFLALELGPEHAIKAHVGEIGTQEKSLTLAETREVGRDGRPIQVIDARPIRRQEGAAIPARTAFASPASAAGVTD